MNKILASLIMVCGCGSSIGGVYSGQTVSTAEGYYDLVDVVTAELYQNGNGTKLSGLWKGNLTNYSGTIEAIVKGNQLPEIKVNFTSDICKGTLIGSGTLDKVKLEATVVGDLSCADVPVTMSLSLDFIK